MCQSDPEVMSYIWFQAGCRSELRDASLFAFAVSTLPPQDAAQGPTCFTFRQVQASTDLDYALSISPGQLHSTGRGR